MRCTRGKCCENWPISNGADWRWVFFFVLFVRWRHALIIIFLATVTCLSFSSIQKRFLLPSTNELIIFHLNVVSADDDDDKTFVRILLKIATRASWYGCFSSFLFRQNLCRILSAVLLWAINYRFPVSMFVCKCRQCSKIILLPLGDSQRKKQLKTTNHFFLGSDTKEFRINGKKGKIATEKFPLIFFSSHNRTSTKSSPSTVSFLLPRLTSRQDVADGWSEYNE